MKQYGKENQIRPGELYCTRCGRKIRSEQKHEMIDGKMYCRKCAQAKKDWDFLEWLAMVEE